MKNAYSSAEATERHMQHLSDNHDLMRKLRSKMTAPGLSMADRVVAFTNLYHLHEGDPYAQRRLVVNMEYVARRHLQMEALP